MEWPCSFLTWKSCGKLLGPWVGGSGQRKDPRKASRADPPLGKRILTLLWLLLDPHPLPPSTQLCVPSHPFKIHQEQLVIFIYSHTYGLPLKPGQSSRDLTLKENQHFLLPLSCSYQLPIAPQLKSESSYPSSPTMQGFCVTCACTGVA